MPKKVKTAPVPPQPEGLFEGALGKPTDHPAVTKVIAALGGAFEVGNYVSHGRRSYDPDVARSLRWEFTGVPAANYYPSHLRVLDGIVVSIVLHPSLVLGGRDRAVVLAVPADAEEVVLRYGVSDGSWPPQIIRRGDRYLFDLSVPQGHWEGIYRLPLTRAQVDVMTASRPAWQQVWDALFKICQSSRFLDDPATLPGDAQRVIARICRTP